MDLWAPAAWPTDGLGLGLEPTDQYIDDIMLTDHQLMPPLFFHAALGALPSIDRPSFPTSDHNLPLPIHPIMTSVTQVRTCHWQGFCDHTISALSPGHVMQHLQQYNLNVEANPPPVGIITLCCWVMQDGTLCGRQVTNRNLGKHVAAVHLKSTARKCDCCGHIVSRSDTLWHHMKKCHGSSN
ncbi:predicted protein [Postia placenta Mad-698-R]|uniref:C2H2-type domain-containing protein n=1 Tax=Postia placenta MAD-698-R-SB12 TaxID=670580 RepID=A0A1X6MZ16_9APHY|nr:hypothetical protein POSPLADRAFT_1046907 [Postia placenta MAD-698-R-SB12]EED85315.1 predicted protein [Postia placenta Mad-698-R]OSX61605.1 hypothetical protein POSPLADRAFT_1046907 [Postia placenta MAD-698-R-SB12]